MSSTPTITKHQHIRDTLERRIATGDFLPGDRLPTDAELVREFSASRPTVAKAVSELERAGLVRRRRGAGTFVRELANKRLMFGLLIPGLGSTEIFEPICGEMARAAHDEHHSLIWGGSTFSPSDPEAIDEGALELCERFVSQKVSGVFFAPLELTPGSAAVNRQIVETFRRARIHVVLLDRDYLPYPERSPFDLVGIDNRRAGLVITRHLLEQGCERPIFVGRPGSANTIDARIAGFAEALLMAGHAFDVERHVHRIDPTDAEALSVIMKREGPDGIVCGNDVTAAHVIQQLDALGAVVPDDVKVSGVDDVKYAELLRVPLTTMHQPCEAIGDAAFRVMLERIANPDMPVRDILLHASLVIRESSRRQTL